MLISQRKADGLVPFPAVDDKFQRRVDRLLNAVHANSQSCMTVAGPLAGVAMSALWRRGVDRVEAARRLTSPSADQLSHVLLILGYTHVDHLVETMVNVLPILAPGGLLGFDANLIPMVGERSPLRRILSRRGLLCRPGSELRPEIVAVKPLVTGSDARSFIN